MKISNSKKALARVIHENGGWVDTAKWAAQDKHGTSYKLKIWFYSGIDKPYTSKGCGWWQTDYKVFDSDGIQCDTLLPSWHQTILSKEEYFHLYPVADDGWIEWLGDDLPVDKGTIIDVKYSDGDELHGAPCGEPSYHLSIMGDEAGAELFGCSDSDVHIVAYRLHKPEVKPELCESVVRSIPEPEIDDVESGLAKALELVKAAAPHLLSDKYKFSGDEVMVERKPTIEQLAADYRKKLDYANRKQQDADDAKASAEAALGELERAGEDLGLLVSPINTDDHSIEGRSVEINDPLQLELGDILRCVKVPAGAKCAIDDEGFISRLRNGQLYGGVYVNVNDRDWFGVFGEHWKFVRRP